METIAFIVLTVLTIASALVVALPIVRNAVICALALAFNLVAIAGFFFLLHAQFIGFLQIMVYAGAIMVLILFVLMLLNIRDEQKIGGAAGFFQRVLGPLLALGFVVILVMTVSGASDAKGFPEPSASYGTVGELGNDLFTRFFYPFEAISLLLVVAMIGAVLLAKRRL